MQAATGTGAYETQVYLSTQTPPAAIVPQQDYYAFDLVAGQTAGLVLTGSVSGQLQLTLEDSTGQLLASGSGGATNYTTALNDFVAPVSGTYYVAVSGDYNNPYSLLVLRDAAFDSEPHDTSATAQDLGTHSTVLGYLGDDQADWYRFEVAAGATLTLSTTTPAGGPLAFVNTLNPQLELYDPTGTLVASDQDSAPDGQNATLTYTATTAGTYQLKISGQNHSSGEYIAKIGGASEIAPAFAVSNVFASRGSAGDIVSNSNHSGIQQ